MNILSCGEALVDLLPLAIDAEDRRPRFEGAPGGAVYNTAMALGRLGEASGFLCGLSRDEFGEQLIAELSRSGVDAQLCPRSELPTPLAVVSLRDGHASYRFHLEQTALGALDESTLPSLPASIQALHFGGLGLMREPCGSGYEALALRESSQRLISLDPNIRPGFIVDERAYRARLERLYAVADVIKVSDEDLAWLQPGISAADFAAERRAAGCSLVVMTRGGEGISAFCGGDQLDVAAPKVSVVDTVGAGDSFDAGLLAGLRRAGLLDKAALSAASPAAIEPALQLAVEVAAISVSRAGANPPWASELDG